MEELLAARKILVSTCQNSFEIVNTFNIEEVVDNTDSIEYFTDGGHIIFDKDSITYDEEEDAYLINRNVMIDILE